MAESLLEKVCLYIEYLEDKYFRAKKETERRKMKNYTDVAVTRNYSLTMLHISKVSDMAQRLGIPQGEVVRNAIDLYYEQLESTEAQAETEPAAEG